MIARPPPHIGRAAWRMFGPPLLVLAVVLTLLCGLAGQVLRETAPAHGLFSEDVW